MIKVVNITSKEAELADALAGDAEVTPLMVNHDPVCYMVRPDDHPHLRTVVSFVQLQKVVETYEEIDKAMRLGLLNAAIENLWEGMNSGRLFV